MAQLLLNARIMQLRTTLLLCLTALSLSSSALADEPFVVLPDDGTIEDHALQTGNDLFEIETALLERYQASGQPLPEVMSVWTTFPFGGSNSGTYYDPLMNDATGLGLEEFFGGDGTFDAGVPPLRCILFHNNVLQVEQAAAEHHAAADGYAEYLFLLELSHLWGPAIKVPAPKPDTLIGFPFHWSFFMSAGASPAGGNQWVDNQDGTFTVTPNTPSTLKFSPLDLYLMGLAPAESVPPFFVIEDVVAPSSPTDPLAGGKVGAHTFPWFADDEPLTVSGTRRDLTLEEVVATNGVRSPVAGTKTNYTLGVVLITSQNDSEQEVTAAKDALRPIAERLAPRFAEATSEQGTLELITNVAEAPSGAGGAGGAGGEPASGGSGGSTSASGGSSESQDSGCSLPTAPASSRQGLLIALGIALLGLRRRAE